MRFPVLAALTFPDDWEGWKTAGAFAWRGLVVVVSWLGVKGLRDIGKWLAGPRAQATMREALAPEVTAMKEAVAEVNKLLEEARDALKESAACTDGLKKVVTTVGEIDADVIRALQRAEENTRKTSSEIEDLHALLDLLLPIERRGMATLSQEERRTFLDLVQKGQERAIQLREIKRGAGLQSGTGPAFQAKEEGNGGK